MKKFLNFLFNLFASLVGADCDWRRDAVDGGALDLGGQGKDRYGR